MVLDNLNTHRMASLYETFPAAEARRLVKRPSFTTRPSTPVWLNMAEIEFNVLTRACLQGRNPDETALQRAINAMRSSATIRPPSSWRFNTQDARTKLHRLYPFNSNID